MTTQPNLNPQNSLSRRPSAPARPRPAPRPLELVFDVAAWLKLQYLCHAGDTEIGAFGVTSRENPLRVVDVRTVRQRTTSVTVEFDDEAVADFFDEMVDAGLSPENFARVWIHTHPGESPDPSHVDEHTFERVFGQCTWAVMFILARGGDTYARLRLASPGRHALRLERLIPVRVDFGQLCRQDCGIATDGWAKEHTKNVHPNNAWPGWSQSFYPGDMLMAPERRDVESLLDWFDGLAPDEQSLFLEQAHQEERPFDGTCSIEDLIDTTDALGDKEDDYAD